MTAVFHLNKKTWELYNKYTPEEKDMYLKGCAVRARHVKDVEGCITLNDILSSMWIKPIRQGLTLGYLKVTAVYITWTPKSKEDEILLKISNLVDISSALPEGILEET